MGCSVFCTFPQTFQEVSVIWETGTNGKSSRDGQKLHSQGN